MHGWLAIIFAIGSLLLGGCASVVLVPAGMSALEAGTMGLGALQAGTAAYSRRKLVSNEAATLEHAASASETALDVLGFRLDRTVERQNATYIRGREVNDTAVEVRLIRRTPKVTEVSIQVGLWGDQTMSLLILNAIKMELNHSPPEGPPSGTGTPREDTADPPGP
jgi:hypothetical protein